MNVKRGEMFWGEMDERGHLCINTEGENERLLFNTWLSERLPTKKQNSSIRLLAPPSNTSPSPTSNPVSLSRTAAPPCHLLPNSQFPLHDPLTVSLFSSLPIAPPLPFPLSLLLPLSSLSLSSMPTPGTAQRISAGSLILGRCLVGIAAARQCLSCSAPALLLSGFIVEKL